MLLILILGPGSVHPAFYELNMLMDALEEVKLNLRVQEIYLYTMLATIMQIIKTYLNETCQQVFPSALLV